MIQSEREQDIERARALDEQDNLAHFKEEFFIPAPDLIYMDGNSLGRLPRRSLKRVLEATEIEWGSRLVQSWGEGWFEAPQRVGEKIARLIGAGPGQVVIGDSTSVNLFKLVMACLMLQPHRHRIISDEFNFPSDLYILQGCVEHSFPQRRLDILRSSDGIHMDLNNILEAIDEDTALVVLSHVAYKSGFLYDVPAITSHAHRAGALVLWDLSHSVGVVPIELDQWGVDFATGCTYKYLNGGPGAPAFLYVCKRLQEEARSPIQGWFGQKDPFAFELDYLPAPGISRFLTGTPPILSLLAMEPGIDLILEAGIERIRKKSVQLTNTMIQLFTDRLAPLGFEPGSPAHSDFRGSHISLRHPDGYQICRALIEEARVIPDFREPDNIRFGVAPLYTSFMDVYHTIHFLSDISANQEYLKFAKKRLRVT